MVLDLLPVVGGVVVIVFLFLFRGNIGDLIDRIREVSYPGGRTLIDSEPQPTKQLPGIASLQLPATDDASQDKDAITSLIQMKEIATQRLLNWVLAPNDSVAKRKWIEKIKAWEEGTAKLLQKAGATDGELSDFRTIVSFNPTGPAVDHEHANWKGMLAARIHTLAQIIRDLEKRRAAFIKLGKAQRGE